MNESDSTSGAGGDTLAAKTAEEEQEGKKPNDRAMRPRKHLNVL